MTPPNACGQAGTGVVVGWVFVLLLLAGCAPVRHAEAVLVLADMVAAEGSSWLEQRRERVRVTPVRYAVGGRTSRGDLYLPVDGHPQAGIVLVPGAVVESKDEPRLVALAQTLARARFSVLVPEMPGFRQLRLQPQDARIVADAFVWLSASPDLAPSGRAGMVAISYAVGPTLLAALEADLRERVRFVVGVGGYYDLVRTLHYVTTGYYETGEGWRHAVPAGYGKLVLLYSALPHVDAADAGLLRAMAERRLQDRAADLSDLARKLSPAGQAVYRFVVNTDPVRSADLYAALPASLRADIAALSLEDKPLDTLRARLILVHGRDDPLIPWTESAALARAVPRAQARLFILDGILGHVDLALSHVLTWRFWREELPDAWRMVRAVDALLSERERHD